MRYMLMESYIWFIARSRSADEYHLYRCQKRERERERTATRSASGYYRSVINIVSFAGARREITIALAVILSGWRPALNPPEDFC